MIDGCSIERYLNNIPKVVMEAIVSVESSRNPFAIGVVGDRLVRQPRNLNEAVVTANQLDELGKNFSVGLAQLNKSNFTRFNLKDVAQAFDRCTNLQAGASVLSECYQRSGSSIGKALSCYYSGNFVTGFEHGYVQKVIRLIDSASNANGRKTPEPSDKAQPVHNATKSMSSSFEKWATEQNQSTISQPFNNTLTTSRVATRGAVVVPTPVSADAAFVF